MNGISSVRMGALLALAAVRMAFGVDVPWTSQSVTPKGSWHAGMDSEAPYSSHGCYAWYSATPGDEVTFAFTGTSVGVLYRPGAPFPEWGLLHRTAARPAGDLEVTLDGRVCEPIDTRAGNGRIEIARNLSEGRHVLRLVNRGREGKPARVAVRGFTADRPQLAPRDWEREDPGLAAEVRQLPPIVYMAETPLASGAIPNTVWQSYPKDGPWGCALRVIEPASPGKLPRTVFAETNSLILDFSLSCDARTILFTMKRNHSRTWQIYAIGTDGTGLRQITATPAAHNASPVFLPDGRIAFVSTRTPRSHTVCQSGPSTQLYVMDADGGQVKRLSSNTLSDVFASVLSDGRIIYTRWEYVDWNLTYRQSLWTQYPDGRQMSLWFGNQSVDPASFIQAQEIPGAYGGVLAVCAPHHGSPYGAIAALYNREGPEATDAKSMRNWTPEFPCIYDTSHFWAWAWPWPISATRALATYGDGCRKRFRLMLLADDGRRATVWEDPNASALRPIPLVVRPKPKVLAEFAPENVPTYTVEAAPPGQPETETVPLGRILVADVYKGLDGAVKPGEARFVRVMEQLPKTVNRTWNGVLDQGPLLGASSYYAKRIWTYAPVAADGSVYLEAPALKEIYLQLVDGEGRELRRMTSAINLMPGETQSCTGCHENRRTAAAPLAAAAARRAPTPITPPDWGNAGVIDYVTVVQPVWNRWCVRCHSGPVPPKGVSLSGGYTRFFNRSYDSLVLRSKSDAASRDYFTGRSKVKPLVQGLHLLWGLTEPYEIRESGTFASRLPEYLAKSHCGADIPLSDRRRVWEWIDAQIPYYATSDHAHVNGKSGRDRWGETDSPALKPWFTQRFMPLYSKHCASCHGKINLAPNLTNRIEPQWDWFDFSQPAWSPVLSAHLPQAAGGRGVGKYSFTGRTDPLWRELEAISREAAEEAWKVPEADMPGFVPRSRGRCEYRP